METLVTLKDNFSPSSMVESRRQNQGFDDAIFLRDGFVTEGTFANFLLLMRMTLSLPALPIILFYGNYQKSHN